jgi:TRAP-type C4-dicarboxylate transport system permease large subunit
MLALVPPLALIVAVLGSIIMGIATVNQAGAIGAVGAVIMGGYRLKSGQRGAYVPTILAVASTAVILVLLNVHHINVKNIQGSDDVFAITIAGIAMTVLVISVGWSLWRTYVIDNTLNGVMVETAKTTSMVFIILVGAAMLTSAFRGFGGEELVKEFLTGLPGGFWAQFIVVMAVIFLLGFFLDFIEIAVVVVPIVAPILLADPSANITAVWLGVMVGLNIQTSFLTPPFGFSLFYLRGVAPPSVKTTQIYKGAAAFIALQLLGLTIAGYYPTLVNYLPNRIQLSSDTAPPPTNPKLQYCLQNYVFDIYDANEDELRASTQRIKDMDLGYLPQERRDELNESLDQVLATFSLVEEVRRTEAVVQEYVPEYRPTHTEVRRIQGEIHDIDDELKEEKKKLNYLRSIRDTEGVEETRRHIESLEADKERLRGEIPDGWDEMRKHYRTLAGAASQAVNEYRRNVDGAYDTIREINAMVSNTEGLSDLKNKVASLQSVIDSETADAANETIKEVQSALREFDGTRPVVEKLDEARDILESDTEAPVTEPLLREATAMFNEIAEWRLRAAEEFAPALARYEETIRGSIGVRMQRRLTVEQAKAISGCQAKHRDVSLSF